MSNDLPFVSAICPTFHRVSLLANALACFIAQDYPADRRELIICDDGNDFDWDESPDWVSYLKDEFNANVAVYGRSERFPDLPAKFNDMTDHANGDVIVLMEDDDVYMPSHITTHVMAMSLAWAESNRDVNWERDLIYSKPSQVLSTYTGQPREEDASGRFHASIAFTTALWHKVGGWPKTKRADFDQQFMAILSHAGATVDPCKIASPSYVFRFGSTGQYHGQSYMQAPNDEEWYSRIERKPGNRDQKLVPFMDDETKRIYDQFRVLV